MVTTIEQPVIRNSENLALKAQNLLGTIKTDSIGDIPIASSPAAPVTIAPVKEIPAATITEEQAPETTAVIIPMSESTIKTIQSAPNMETTKSGDTWFNIQLPGSGGSTTPTDPNAPTPDEKNRKALMWGAVILTSLVLVIWLVNRTPAKKSA